MGFRNPLTTLSASDITPGVLPPGVILPAGQVSAGALNLLVVAQALANETVTGPAIAAGAVTAAKIAADTITAAQIAAGAIGVNELAANAITGKTITGGTITGATLQTATAPAKRVKISSATTGRVDFHTGDADENVPGLLEVGIDQGAFPAGSDRPYLKLTPPELNSGPTPQLTFLGGSRDGFANGQLDVNGTLNAVGLWVNDQPYARQRAWIIPRGTDASFAAGSFVALITGTVAAAPPGDYLVTLALVLSASAAAVANVRLTGPTGLYSINDPRADLTTQAKPYTFTTVIQDHPGGIFTLTASVQLGAGTCFVKAGGSRVTVAYLGQR